MAHKRKSIHWRLDTNIPFGKWRDEILENIIEIDPHYVEWMFNNFDGDDFDDNILDKLIETLDSIYTEKRYSGASGHYISDPKYKDFHRCGLCRRIGVQHYPGDIKSSSYTLYVHLCSQCMDILNTVGNDKFVEMFRERTGM